MRGPSLYRDIGGRGGAAATIVYLEVVIGIIVGMLVTALRADEDGTSTALGPADRAASTPDLPISLP